MIALLVGQPRPDSGLLTVRSNMPGLQVYLEGEYLGRAPVNDHRLAAGKYLVSIVSDDSLETVYWRLRTGRIGEKLSAVWTLAAINAGTQSVTVEPGMVTDVFLDYGRIANAPNEAKALTCCGLGGAFLVSAAIGFLIHLLFFKPND